MPKFLFGRLTIIATQVEARTEQEAIALLNQSNELMSAGAQTPLPNVGKTHSYRKAWVAQEGTMAAGRQMILDEVRRVIWMMDEDGGPRPVILNTDGKQANGAPNPRG
jgi:hypothetical protein